MSKNGSFLFAAVLLTACGAPKPQESPPRTALAPAAVLPLAGPGIFRIDPAHSELRLLVHRAGAMARLGHNHVIVNDAMSGWVKFSGDLSNASFALAVPVAAFVVDDSRLRSEEGADFADTVPDDAKLGTRHNMLSETLLDGARYPTVTLASVTVTPSSTPGMASAALTVSVAGHMSALTVPFAFETAAGRVTASGSIDLRQSALGLTPFSVLLGALQVQDELTVKFVFVGLAT